MATVCKNSTSHDWGKLIIKLLIFVTWLQNFEKAFVNGSPCTSLIMYGLSLIYFSPPLSTIKTLTTQFSPMLSSLQFTSHPVHALPRNLQRGVCSAKDGTSFKLEAEQNRLCNDEQPCEPGTHSLSSAGVRSFWICQLTNPHCGNDTQDCHLESRLLLLWKTTSNSWKSVPPSLLAFDHSAVLLNLVFCLSRQAWQQSPRSPHIT